MENSKNNNNNTQHSKKREFPADGNNNNNQHGKNGFKKSRKDLIGRAKALLPQRKALPIYSGKHYN